MGSDNLETHDDEFWWDTDAVSPRATLVARSMHEILNERNVDAVDEFHSDQLEYRHSSDELGGPDTLKDDARMFLSAFPDLEATILDVFGDGGSIAVHYRIEGTHAGTFEDIPPTDQRIEASGIGIAEFDGDEIVTFSLVFDNLGLLQDLGLIK